MVEEIDVEKCNLQKLRKSVTLTLTLTLTLDQVSVISACAIHTGTTSVPDHVTIVSNSTEIWPFEICVISDIREV